MESRMELGLRKILGEQVEVPEPMSRAEELLKQIAEQGISGGGGSGTPGVGIQKIEKTNTEGLVDTYTVTLTDSSTYTFTVTNGQDGEDGVDGTPGQTGSPGTDGYSPIITENSDNTDSIYKLDITTKTGSFTTPNLKGADGVDGTGGSGTSDYTQLTNKPTINNVEVTGNKTLADYGIQASSDDTLSTTDKTIVGAINELYSMITSASQTVDEINGEVV